jgi:hypothetical protein
MALAKQNFGEILFRDETEKVYFGVTILLRRITKDAPNVTNEKQAT